MKAELVFSAEDLAQIRFAVSPLWEVVTSFRVLLEPSAYPVHTPWVSQVRPRLEAAGLDRGRLASLIVPGTYVPDFLNPVPADCMPSLATELDLVRATPAHRIAADLDVFEDAIAADPQPFLRRLRESPEAAVAELVAEIDEYWAIALAPYWSRVRTVLEADIFHHARQAAEQGVARLLNGLHPTLSWSEGALQMLHRPCVLCRDGSGPGMVLVPSSFVWSRVLTRAAPDEAPQLCYPARGVGTLWDRRRAEPSEAVAAVLGRSRTLLLTELEAPASTSELATRTGMSAGGVSEHLTALRGAGMVSAHRAGRSVLYARTAVADSLLAAAF